MTRTGGVRDNKTVEQRGDLLLFTSVPLEEPLDVVGEVIAELSATRDNPNADLFVRLCDVDQRGRLRPLGIDTLTLRGDGPLRPTAPSLPAIAAAVKAALDPDHRLPPLD